MSLRSSLCAHHTTKWLQLVGTWHREGGSHGLVHQARVPPGAASWTRPEEEAENHLKAQAAEVANINKFGNVSCLADQ